MLLSSQSIDGAGSAYYYDDPRVPLHLHHRHILFLPDLSVSHFPSFPSRPAHLASLQQAPMPIAVVVVVAAVVGAVEAVVFLLEELGRRRFKTLLRRLKAAVTRQVTKARERKRRSSFHYDACSYALNFDDGSLSPLCQNPHCRPLPSS